MPEATTLAKAQLVEIELGDGDNPSREANLDATVTVQFNPETLKVGYSNTMEGGDQTGGSAVQFVSKSSTKLSVELWFDASAMADEDDVRRLTKKVNNFITPAPRGEGMAPPAVRFAWGSFLFEGVVDSMDETLELFSADGRPLRAKVSLSISSQDIQFHEPPPPSSGGSVPGTSPQQQARDGDSLQTMMGRNAGGRSGGADGWQSVASANGIEQPRRLAPGTFVDLAARTPTGGAR